MSGFPGKWRQMIRRFQIGDNLPPHPRTHRRPKIWRAAGAKSPFSAPLDSHKNGLWESLGHRRPSEQWPDPTTNSNHMWRRIREQWWEASALTHSVFYTRIEGIIKYVERIRRYLIRFIWVSHRIKCSLLHVRDFLAHVNHN